MIINTIETLFPIINNNYSYFYSYYVFFSREKRKYWKKPQRK